MLSRYWFMVGGVVILTVGGMSLFVFSEAQDTQNSVNTVQQKESVPIQQTQKGEPDKDPPSEQKSKVVIFNDLTEYILFENRMKAELGMPIVPVDSKTGEPRPNDQLTTDYSLPIFHTNPADKRILVTVDDFADTRGNPKVPILEQKDKGWRDLFD